MLAYGEEQLELEKRMSEDELDFVNVAEITQMHNNGFYDVKRFYEERFDNMQIFRLYQGWQDGVDYNQYADKKINEEKMYVLKTALNKGFDITELKKVRGHKQTRYALADLIRNKEKQESAS